MIAILIADAEHRTVVAERLIAQHEIRFDLPQPRADGDDAADDFDAVVADAGALSANAVHIVAERRRRDPMILPVLLLGDRRSVAGLNKALWRIVDEVVLRPLDKRELQTRIDGLVRSCELSRRVHAAGRLRNHERTAAQRFQKAALPRLLPRVPGLTFGAFYRPGTDERHVGGDWYDALQLSDGRVLFSIGDVCGSGLEATAAMATVRHVFRGAAHVNPDPLMLLDAAHRTLRAENGESLVTAFVGIFDPITSLLTFASAGHPRPLLRDTHGAIVELCAAGAPLGLPFTVERTINLASLELGSLLVLYTDGLTEATRDPIAGEAGLRRALADPSVRSAPNVAVAIHDALIGDVSPDDVAILTIAHVERDVASERLSHWSFDARDGEAARDVRAELVAELERIRLGEADVANAELVFSD